MDLYLIYCPFCRKSTTVGKAPKQVGYSKVVNCSVCNRVLDASRGKKNRVTGGRPVGRHVVNDEPSLLSVSE